ncbi:MAG: hypothetical protein GC159_00830 [Phycisphaera sp.]|nr:hypothetical protein [Phycisphaera sp.]
MSDIKAQFQQLLTDLIDRHDDEAAAKLELLLTEQPQLMAEYIDYVAVDGLLHHDMSNRPFDMIAPAIPHGRSRPWKPALLAAATIALAVSLWWIFREPPVTPGPTPRVSQQPVALLVGAADATWDSGSAVDAMTLPGAELGRSTLDLASGITEVLFNSGAVVRFQGPGRLELTGPNSAHLHRGSVLAYVPPRARNFSLTAPGSRVVDLGTEFAMRVTPDKQTVVQVFTGRVQLYAADRVMALTESQAARVEPDGNMQSSAWDDGLFQELRVHKLTALINGSFETSQTIADIPGKPGVWGGDMTRIVEAEQGIAPFEGRRMLRFEHTTAEGASDSSTSDAIQIIDISDLYPRIDAGRVHIDASAYVNRIAGDQDTATKFGIYIQAEGDRQPGEKRVGLDRTKSLLESDDNPSTWERISTTMLLPKGTRMVVVRVAAIEKVNRTTGVEFEGHYADGVDVEIKIDPPAAGKPAD